MGGAGSRAASSGPRESVTAVVIGAQTEALAAEAAAKGVGKVVRVEHPLLAQYTADGFSLALQQLIQRESPRTSSFPHTYQVRDYAPALACRMGQVLIGDVMAIDDGPVFTRQLLQGRLNGSYRHAGNGPCFVSVQAGAFRADGFGREARARRRSQRLRLHSMRRRSAPTPANLSAARRRPSTWARRNEL